MCAGGRTCRLLTLSCVRARRCAADNRYCAYVQQFDALWPMLSARDHLKFAFMLFQPQLASQARNEAIDALLAKVGLTEHQKTRAGNQFVPGLSGGLRRRLSIALALAKQPQVLFLDEPTSGLDSAASVQILSALQRLTTLGVTVKPLFCFSRWSP